MVMVKLVNVQREMRWQNEERCGSKMRRDVIVKGEEKC
jgi:hypothetical protein